MSRSQTIVAVAFALLVAGCAPAARGVAVAPRSTAFEADPTTSLGQRLGPLTDRHPGQSGFLLVNDGRDAFRARAALADLAERSIDAQYYIWESDAVGTLLLERLVRAADRGTRVRLLVDDINLKGVDAGLAGLDAHPNIEVRLYNPFTTRNPLRLGRRLDFLFEFGRLDHRMHNKVFAVDNEMAVIQGNTKTIKVDPSVEGLRNLKAGDDVVVRHTETVALVVRKPS